MNGGTTLVVNKPEVMSPAGYWPQLEAAINAGADAVYFGLTHFTARAKVGFALEELAAVMQTLHRHGVRGYLTFNTLVFDHEWAAAARALEAVARAGVDAVIVQDVGIARLVRQITPDIEIHGSTQMSITSAEGAEFARSHGVDRVVLARELSLGDIRRIRERTDLPLEIFVHGALCVSYSGQCFSSEAWGGRSANRGACAQACRLPYELIVDGELRPLGDARYLLSPGDLSAIGHIPQILPLGIASLKIEGRYKDADYVALTTDAYRRAVDAAWAGLPTPLGARDQLHLEQVYSRGLGAHFLGGTDHQAVVRGRAPRHRGVLLGSVAALRGDGIEVALAAGGALAPPQPGDGIVFDAAAWRSPEVPEEGVRIVASEPLGSGVVRLRCGPGALDVRRIRVGDLVWRSDDPATRRVARAIVARAALRRRWRLAVAVTAHVGRPLQLHWWCCEMPQVRVTVGGDGPLTAARARPADAAWFGEHLGRLGETAFVLESLELDIAGEVFVPASVLNALRREACTLLAERLDAPPARQVTPVPPAAIATAPPAAPMPARLHLLVRSAEQLAAALALQPDSITLDWLELYGLRPAVEQVRAAGIEVRVASPRVLKPEEQNLVHFLLKLDATILVRSSGLLHALLARPHPPLIGDFSLNVANAATARAFLEHGLGRITPTHDCNAAQIAALADAVGPRHVEVIAYQHLPVFHTEHCVFCRFLSQGTSSRDCGHPCEQHRVALRDARGRAHPVLADVGCRNTVFGAEAQEASRHLADWRAVGIGDVRLEFVHEDAAQLTAVALAFRQALAGDLTGAELGRRLRRLAPQSTTEGSLFVPPDRDVIPLL